METSLIIFDYDGVIVDSFPMLAKVYDIYAREFGIQPPEDIDFYREFFELDWKRTVAKWGITTDEQLRRSQEIFHKVMPIEAQNVEVFKDIPSILDALSKRYTLAIASNNHKEYIIPKLEKHGLKRYFSGFYDFSDGGKKPLPNMLLTCMKDQKKLPKETVFVGDMDGDIVAGKAANIKKVVAVTYGYQRKHKLQGADVIVDSPVKIPGAVL